MIFMKEVIISKINNIKINENEVEVCFETTEGDLEECSFSFKTIAMKERFFRMISNENRTGVVFSMGYDTKDNRMWINEVRNFKEEGINNKCVWSNEDTP